VRKNRPSIIPEEASKEEGSFNLNSSTSIVVEDIHHLE
jgi:hypothetical protein